ncbi:hypothetical protein BGX27_004901 [Mortierella sp. AM989]|nr:hypothetical protein BGX27_004901 [Mortierella sp. AM989]
MERAQQPSIETQIQGQAQVKVFYLQELRSHIAQYLDLKYIAACCLVSQQWHRDWSPICWRDVRHKEPSDFTRNGHLIRTMELWSSSKFRPLADIRDHCPNLLSLKYIDFHLKAPAFEMALGFKPGHSLSSPTISEPELMKEQNQRNRVEDAKVLDLQSQFDPLKSLELFLPSEACEIVLPRLIQAKRAGQLQNLRSFRMSITRIFYTCIMAPLEKPRYLKLSDILTFLDELPDLKTFSTCEIMTTDDEEAEEFVQPTELEYSNTDKTGEYHRLTNLEIAPKKPSIFERLVSRTPHLTSLSVHCVGTINLFPLIQQYCPNLISLELDMESMHYQSNPIIDKQSLDQEQKYCDWILLFKSLPKLEEFSGIYISMPMVVLQALATSCPRLSYFKTCEDSNLSAPGISYLLQKCLALKKLTVDQDYNADLFKGDQPWKAPLEGLCLNAVSLLNSEDCDIFRERMRQLPQLKSLKIEYAANMQTQAFLEPNKKACPKALESFAHNIGTESGNDASKTAFPNLESLTLGFFVGRSEETFQAFVDAMPHLNHLAVGDVYNREAILQARNRHINHGIP